MIEFSETDVDGFEAAFRGIRNSWGSHQKSDSEWVTESGEWWFEVGQADMKLGTNLTKSGPSHRKYLRQIVVWVDINAPLYWWKEFDQYKVGTVTDSESTMHTIQRHEFTRELFSFDDTDENMDIFLGYLNLQRELYVKTKDKKYWRKLIQWLPSGWMQKRTTLLNYEVIANAYWTRKNHRLTEWHDFCTWAESLPYAELIIGRKKDESI